MVNFTMLVRNRPKLTKQSLESLGDNAGMTCMIRDDWSDHETWDIVEDWSGNNAIKGRVVYHQGGQRVGTGPARNDVIATSEQAFGRGDYLYLSDNDVFFTPGWLETLIQAYESAWHVGYRVVGAYNHPFHQPADIVRPDGIDYVVRKVNALATQSMLMRWEVWDKYGPFCQTPVDKVCQSEDVDFCNRITKDGFKVGVVSPPLIVATGITNTFGEKIPGYELVKAQCPPEIICE